MSAGQRGSRYLCVFADVAKDFYLLAPRETRAIQAITFARAEPRAPVTMATSQRCSLELTTGFTTQNHFHPFLNGPVDFTTIHVLAVVFIATLIRSAFGFGEALFAVPLLVLRLPLEIAAPLAVLISITIALIVVAQDWRQVHARSMGWLMCATIFGIPLGLMLLTSSHQQLVKGAMALIIMAFAIYSLLGERPPELPTDSMPWMLGCGFAAGILGGAYGMNGPPLAIYGAMRRWTAQQFRATLQGYFLPASVLGMIGYWVKGLWVPAVTHYYLISLPAMLLAIPLGKFANHRMHGHSFLKYIYSALLVIGVVLLVQAWCR